MTKRFAVVLAGCLGGATLAAVASLGAAQAPSSTVDPYKIEFTFHGLATFVPVGMTSKSDAKELWVLLPAGNDPKWIRDARKLMNHEKSFRPRKGKHPVHHAILYLPAGQVTNASGAAFTTLLFGLDGNVIQGGYDVELGGLPAAADVHIAGFENVPEVRDRSGVARACEGCLSADPPEPLPNGIKVPLSARMVFRNGETVSVAYHKDYNWTYSHGDEVIRRLPVTVTVTSKEITGPATLAIRRHGSSDRVVFPIAPPPEGEAVRFIVANMPLGELYGHVSSTATNRDLEHFKLGYLLAPKKIGARANPPTYDYERYIYPVVLKGGETAMHKDHPYNGDPFCTTPSRMAP